MLLLHGPSVKNFNGLKAIDGNEHETFHLAREHLGVLKRDYHWHKTLSDSAKIRMPSYLGVLFSIICGIRQLPNISTLWEQHRNALCSDFLQRNSAEI